MCSPRAGPGRACGSGPDSRSGDATCRTVPSRECSYSTIRASSSAAGTSFTGDARDARPAQHLQPFLARAAAEDLVEDRRELLAAPIAVGEGRELLGEVRSPDRAAEQRPELLLRTGDDDPAVRGLEVLERDDRRMRRVAPPRRDIAARGRPGADVHQLVQGRVEQRDVAVATDTVAACTPEAGQHGDRRRIAAGQVDEREAALGRRAVRVAGQAHPPCEPLHHVVVAALGGARPGHAEARERAADDPRVDVLQVVVGQPQLRRLVAAQVRVDDVGAAHQVLEDVARLRVAQVERDAPLVAVERLEEERVLALGERRHVAADVAAGGRVLDLDHVGAEVGELQRAPGPGAELLDREDPDVSQRLHGPPPPAVPRPRARRD